MKLVCPSCGYYAAPDGFVTEGEEQRALLLAFRLPAPLAVPMQQYLRLFRPAERALTARRIEALLGELLPLVEAARIERRGRLWPAPLDHWRAALEEIVAKRERLTLPLKSHGYLLEIVVGYADRAEAGAEAQREASRANRHREDRSTAGPQPLAAALDQLAPPARPEKVPMPAHVKAALKGLKQPKEDADAAD